MRLLIFVALLGAALHGAAAVTHSMKYFYTASSGVPNFPEFVAVGMVDGVQIDHYDSNTKKAEPKQNWMKNVLADHPLYLERSTETSKDDQQTFKDIIDTVKQRFNHTGGVYVLQVIYGCEWDDETKEVKGVWQIGFNGEDFISYDAQTKTWITQKPQAIIIRQMWDNNSPYIEYWKKYLTQGCIDWLTKYLDYGNSSLLRTVLPSVSLLQKTPSSPVSCHATGFHPDRAALFWRKDGEELHEEVDRGEILPNQDGTFQMSVDLNLSSVRPEDWRRYDCVFQLARVKDIVTRLDKNKIRSNGEKPFDWTVIIITAVVVLTLCLIIGFIVYKKKKAECTSCTDDIPETKKLNPPPAEPPSDSSV